MSVRKINQRLVSPEKFCAAWNHAVQKGYTIQDLADHLEMTYTAVANRRTYYKRVHGLKFPHLAAAYRGPGPIDAAALQKILNKKLR